jgi:hypothetical protein
MERYEIFSYQEPTRPHIPFFAWHMEKINPNGTMEHVSEAEAKRLLDTNKTQRPMNFDWNDPTKSRYLDITGHEKFIPKPVITGNAEC